mmetsp:Transcript_14195/g.39003  ORF Transcript_14195/g.39003 Transcript_14195/m.39003 type:complete len:279 (+) Transcript_14195:662-1498(+)
MPTRFPIGFSFCHWPAVGHSARVRGEKHQGVEEQSDLVPRLVDDHQASHAKALRHDAQGLDAGLGVSGREPGGGLVAEEQGGLRRHAPRQGDSAPLASGDTPNLSTSNHGVSNAPKVESGQKHVDPALDALVGPSRLPLERGVEPDRLANGPMWWHHLLLTDIGGDPPEEPVARKTVDQDLAAIGAGLLGREHVQQGGLAATARPHDGHQRAGLEVPRAGLQHRPTLAAPPRRRQGEAEVLEGDAGGRQGIRRLLDSRLYAGWVRQQQVRARAGLCIM